MALASSPENAERARSDLSLTGTSPIEDAIRSEASVAQREQQQKDLWDVITSDVPISKKRELVKNELTKEERVPLVLDTAKRVLAARAEAANGIHAGVQLNLAEHISEALLADKEIARLAEGANLHFPDGGLRQFLDVTAGSILPGWGTNVIEVINESTPGFANPLNAVGRVGNVVADYKEYVSSLPPKERVATVRKLVNAIDNNKFWTSDNGFMKFDLMHTLLGDLHDDTTDIVMNDIFSVLDFVGFGLIRGTAKGGAKLAKEAMLGKEVTKEIDIGGKTITVTAHEKSIDQAIREIERAVSDTESLKDKKSISSIIDNLDPAAGKKLAEEALNDNTGNVAKAVGETQESLTEGHITPNKPGDPVTPAPDLNDDLATILDYNPSRIFATSEELAASETKLDERLRSLEMATPRVFLNKLETVATGSGYIAKYRIGDTALNGYSNLSHAKKVASTFRKEQAGDYQILARKWDEGEFKPLSEFDTKGGKNEYIIEFNVNHVVDKTDALADTKIVLDNGLSGKLAAYADKSATFMEWIRHAGSVAADVEAAKLQALEQIMDPMTKLRSKDQAKVLAVLDEGDRIINEDGSTGRWFTPKELMDDYFAQTKNPEKLIRAYKAVQHHQELVRSMINDGLRRRLVADGVKEIRFKKGLPAGENVFLGRVVTLPQVKDGDRVVKRLWDSEAGNFVDVTPERLADMNQEGVFVKLSTAIRKDGNWIEYAHVKHDGKFGKVNELPDQVLSDLPGYIARIYDAPYILKKRTKRFVNGLYNKDQLISIRMYSNKGDALIDAETMRLSDPDNADAYIPVKANELIEHQLFADVNNLEFMESSGQLYTSKRGKEIYGIDGRRELRSVSDSILAGRARAARSGTLDPLIEKLTRNWELKYGKLYGKDGKFPIDRIVEKQEDVENPVFKDAVALQDHIKLLAGVDDTMSTKFMRDFMVNIAEFAADNFESVASRRFQSWILRNRNRNLINGAKGAAFTSFLIFRPIRQLFLQAQQASVYLGIEHGLKYAASTQGMKDMIGLTRGVYFRTTDLWEANAKSMAKTMGITVEEYTEFVDAYRRSGLPAAIDSHQYAILSNVDRQTLGRRSMYEAGMDHFNLVRKYMRRWGFDLGEQTQLMSAFLFARNKWIKNNPTKSKLWSKPENLAVISGMTRDLSFNMNKAGALRFQKGGLGLMFQFLSHTTKSAQALLPQTSGKLAPLGKFSSKAFTNKEKLRIAAIQFGMYGTGAFGVNKAYEALVAEIGAEPTPEFNSAVEEGVMGTLLNMTLRLADDQELVDKMSDIEFSSSFAPFSGIFGSQGQIFGNPMGSIVDAFLLSDPSVAEFALGPLWSLGKEAKETAELANALLGTKLKNGKLPTSEETFAVLDDFGRRFVPMYGNFLRGRVEHAMQRHITNSGRMGVEITEAEARLRQFTGMTSRRQRQVNDMLIKFQGITGSPKEENIKAELNGIADKMYEFAVRTIQDRNDGRMDTQQVIKLLNEQAVGMREVLDFEEFDYIYNRRLRQLAVNDLSPDGSEMKLTKAIIGGMNAPIPDLYQDEFLTRLKNMTPFAGKDELIKRIEELR